jgi:diguanylate cyclase (GGDEF)-like protein
MAQAGRGRDRRSWQVPDKRSSSPQPTDRRRWRLRGRTVASPRSVVYRLTVHRPPIAWTLSALFMFKGFICLTTVAYPISAAEPVGLVAIAGTLGIAAAAAIWLLGSRIPLLGYELLAAGGSLTTSWLVAHAATPGGMMVAAFAYPWTAIYAAHFFPRRGVIVQGVLISVGFSVGLALGGLHHVAVYWTIVTVTIWSICLLLGNLSESMRRQAGTDQLTGLLNRNGFQTAALRERALADRTGSPLTLAVLDLDGFKQINDREGHLAGDEILNHAAAILGGAVRTEDTAFRVGGDEFALILPETTAEEALPVVERLSAALAGAADRPLSASFGVAVFPRDGGGHDALFRAADAAMYTAKRDGSGIRFAA